MTLAQLTAEDVDAFLAENATSFNVSTITSFLEKKATSDDEIGRLVDMDSLQLVTEVYNKIDNTYKVTADMALSHDDIAGALKSILGGMNMATNTENTTGAKIDSSSATADNAGGTIITQGTTTGTGTTHKTTKDRAAANFKALPKEVQDQVLAKVTSLSDTLAQMSTAASLTGYVVNSAIRNAIIDPTSTNSKEPKGIMFAAEAKKVDAFVKKYPEAGVEQSAANVQAYQELIKLLQDSAASGDAIIEAYVPSISGQKLAGIEVNNSEVIPMNKLASQVFLNYAGYLTSNINAGAGVKVDGYKAVKKTKAEITSQAPDKNELAIKLLGKTTAMQENPECVKYASVDSPDGKTHPYTVRSAQSFKYHCKVKKNGKEEDRVKTIRFSQAVELPEQVRAPEYEAYAGEFPAIYGKGLTSTPEQFTGTKDQIQQVAENLAAMAKTGDAALLEQNELLKDIFSIIKGSEEAGNVDAEDVLS